MYTIYFLALISPNKKKLPVAYNAGGTKIKTAYENIGLIKMSNSCKALLTAISYSDTAHY